jgi:RNA polymerase sigma factor (sigma-70 family)
MRTATTPHSLTRKLLRVVRNSGERSDRELLVQFATDRDEDAFEELVRRHGRMVLSVARRVTRSQQDAEDAFQAAFLVLARRATHIKHPEQLANWLYGVAYRTAMEARAARRRVLEHPVSAIPEPAAQTSRDDGGDLRRVIDEELARLPEKYRTAVVLCDLEGLPRTEAATRLKIPEGTLSSRLAYARKVLANRLTRRGISSTAGGIAALLAGEATGAYLPNELVCLTARVASRAASGGAVPHDLLSPSVSHLTEGVMKIMLANRLRSSITAGVLACGLVALGVFGFAQQPFPQPGQPLSGSNAQNNNPYRQNTAPAEKEIPKIAAKGIEDEDVPYSTLPIQAVVRIENNKLIIRTRLGVKEPVAHQQGNGTVTTTYENATAVHGTAINDISDLAVFDMKGNRLLPKAWKEKLKVDNHVLIGFEGKLPNPREMTLFKDDTLLLILPANQTWSGTPHAPATVPLQYYTPVTTYVPQTTYVPRTTLTPTPSPAVPVGTPPPGVEEGALPTIGYPPPPTGSNYAAPQVNPPPRTGTTPPVPAGSQLPTITPLPNQKAQPTPQPDRPPVINAPSSTPTGLRPALKEPTVPPPNQSIPSINAPSPTPTTPAPPPRELP